MNRPVGGEIRSAKNPWIQSLVKLHRVSERQEQQKFLLEGSNLVLAALESSWPLDCLLVTDEWLSAHRQKLTKYVAQHSLQLISPQVLKALTSTQSPEGVVAVAQIGNRPFELALPSLGIALDEVQEPGNIGTIIRAVAACSGDGVYLGKGCVDPYNEKLLRSTAGLWFRKQPQQVDLIDWIDRCTTDKVQVLGASAEGRPFWELDLRAPTLFVLGNEGSGLSNVVRSRITEYVSIPMSDQVESLNVAMAGTLLLYEAKRQRQ